MWSTSVLLLGIISLCVSAMPFAGNIGRGQGTMSAMNMAMMTNMNANTNRGFANMNMNRMNGVMSNRNTAGGASTTNTDPAANELLDEALEVAADAKAMKEANKKSALATSNVNATGTSASSNASTFSTHAMNSSNVANSGKTATTMNLGLRMMPTMMYFPTGGSKVASNMAPADTGAANMMGVNSINMVNSGTRFAEVMPGMMGRNLQGRMVFAGNGVSFGRFGMNSANANTGREAFANMNMAMNAAAHANTVANSMKMKTAADAVNVAAMNTAMFGNTGTNAGNLNNMLNVANQNVNAGMMGTGMHMDTGSMMAMNNAARMESRMANAARMESRMANAARIESRMRNAARMESRMANAAVEANNAASMMTIRNGGSRDSNLANMGFVNMNLNMRTNSVSGGHNSFTAGAGNMVPMSTWNRKMDDRFRQANAGTNMLNNGGGNMMIPVNSGVPWIRSSETGVKMMFPVMPNTGSGRAMNAMGFGGVSMQGHDYYIYGQATAGNGNSGNAAMNTFSTGRSPIMTGY